MWNWKPAQMTPANLAQCTLQLNASSTLLLASLASQRGRIAIAFFIKLVHLVDELP